MIPEFYFNSHDEICKDPFGAVPKGREIIFSVKLSEDYDVILKIFRENPNGEKNYSLIKMENLAGLRKATYTPEETGLYFYHFEVIKDNEKFYFGNSHDSKGGLAINYDKEYELRPFQITVHNYLRKSPSWYKEGIFYQIFPDRFFNGNEDGRIDGIKPNSFIYGSWYDTPYYVRNEKGGIERWDFKGGNLEGIRKKIPYLKEMGITGIYLNPIFLARSNHRYDTGDYHKIDPMVGTEESFIKLCEELKENGIRVILDGVFNHTGSDSIYFNSVNSYDSIGAFNSIQSKYYNWFSFKNYPTEYECWWGVTDLPNINEDDESYKDFILNDKDGVIPYWIRRGASGWRLDVADELPDSFIKGIRESMEKESFSQDESDVVLIGEVWEDASNKIAYSKRREYFMGDELHGVMNYPLKDSIIQYLRGEINAETIYRNLISLMENYPEEAWFSSLNSLSTHDTRRIRTELNHIDLEKLAIKTLFTMPGVPCIYYGDEAGLFGERDPYNRAAFPWGRESQKHMTFYKEAIDLRKSSEVFTKGSFRPFFSKNVFGYVRYLDNKYKIILINRDNFRVELNIKIKVEGKDFLIHEFLEPLSFKVQDAI